jgi:hypothetical protein
LPLASVVVVPSASPDGWPCASAANTWTVAPVTCAAYTCPETVTRPDELLPQPPSESTRPQASDLSAACRVDATMTRPPRVTVARPESGRPDRV